MNLTPEQLAQALFGNNADGWPGSLTPEQQDQVKKDLEAMEARMKNVGLSTEAQEVVDVFAQQIKVDTQLRSISDSLNPLSAEERELSMQIDNALNATDDVDWRADYNGPSIEEFREQIAKPDPMLKFLVEPVPPKKEISGGRVNYYLVKVDNPQREDQVPYQAECEDIIEALGLNFDEGNIFKEIWRTANERTHGVGKVGNSPLRGAQKIVHYANRILKRAQRSE